MRSLISDLITEKNKLTSSSAWLLLLVVEVSADTILRFAQNPEAVVFRGETYSPFAMKIEDIAQDLKGSLHEVSVSVSNVTREVSAYIEFHDLLGARVTLLCVNSAHVANDAAVVFEEHYEITEIKIKGSQFATFMLGHDRISQHQFPSGRFFRDNCRWIYKSAECGYAGGLATCSKNLNGANGCRAHANVPRFGGFPLLSPQSGRL